MLQCHGGGLSMQRCCQYFAAQVVDWVSLLIDAHFSVLLMMPEAKHVIVQLQSFTTSQVQLEWACACLTLPLHAAAAFPSLLLLLPFQISSSLVGLNLLGHFNNGGVFVTYFDCCFYLMILKKNNHNNRHILEITLVFTCWFCGRQI